ncbi:TIM-barrel domain-containing protein [Duncaniella muris]|jgi:alpha-D-xyloside xylohydrolase|uniref:TIM-barrel domain-containing protein n=1 Tax=Duncaniella muris TaxID=2094150 RepID=UPI002677144C|nr:TIM-barrel domain-containing protein [Duncaniella muris]
MKSRTITASLLTAMLFASCAAGRYEKSERGITVNIAAETENSVRKVRLQVIDDKIIRVSATPDKKFSSDTSLVVIPPRANVEYTIAETDSTVSLSTSQLTATVSFSTGDVKFYNKDGRLIVAEADGGREFSPIEVEGTKGYTVRQVFESLDKEEGIYGLGQHQSDEFNYKGKNEELFQYNTKVSVPFIVSTDNYGILWDSYSLCRFGNPEPYKQLGQVFKLYDKDGKEGALTGTYVPAKAEEPTIVQREDSIYFEHLIRKELKHVVNLPQDFNYQGSHVTYEGEIEPSESGEFKFILYYSGYMSVFIDGKEVVPERWRTAWNPNSYKFSVNLEAGKRVPVKIQWEPNGAVAYCGLRVYSPVDDKEQMQMSWWGEMQSQIDYYFIYGEDMDDVIHGYRTLTGKAPMMAKWVMGYWQSREKYNTSDEVLSTFAEFRRRGIPIDNIVIDWLHWKQDSWGSHEFDPERFPDPKGMVDSIHNMNGRVMISVWPKFYVTTEHYKEFDKNGWMYQLPVKDSIRDWVGPGYLSSFYDAYSPDARKLFWKQIEDHYVPVGMDAWWMDASEPNIRDCTDLQYRKDLITPTALGPSTKYFNAYGLMNADAIYNGQRGINDNRVFLLTRSGFAGQQRYSTATWSGDIATRWEDMKAQISAGLNFAASGIPWWSMDIGGFCVEDRFVAAAAEFDKTGRETPDMKEWRELNTRWYQFGAFAPMFRAHGQWPYREIFNIAPENHPAYKSVVYYTNLRYDLMPYIYSLAAKTHFDDYTIMRPMVMDFTADKATRNIGDQYMFGPSLLVAPVYTYGATSREVYFPEGADWYDFYTGKEINGGQTLKVAAPYERIPLFVRSGSIIPFGPAMQWSAEKPADMINLYVYAGEDGKFVLYEDENTNYNYEKGQYAMIPFSWNDETSTLTIGKRAGQYPGMLRNRKFNIIKVSEKTPVSYGRDKKGVVVAYNGEAKNVKL